MPPFHIYPQDYGKRRTVPPLIPCADYNRNKGDCLNPCRNAGAASTPRRKNTPRRKQHFFPLAELRYVIQTRFTVFGFPSAAKKIIFRPELRPCVQSPLAALKSRFVAQTLFAAAKLCTLVQIQPAASNSAAPVRLRLQQQKTSSIASHFPQNQFSCQVLPTAKLNADGTPFSLSNLHSNRRPVTKPAPNYTKTHFYKVLFCRLFLQLKCPHWKVHADICRRYFLKSRVFRTSIRSAYKSRKTNAQ